MHWPPHAIGAHVPFRPQRLLIYFDDERGRCGRVVPRMKELLEHRAFLVDTATVAQGPVDLSPYQGLVLGTPVFGLGIRGVGPTPALTAAVEAMDGLDELKVALFCVYTLSPGTTFDRMRGLVLSKGATFVAEHAYALLRPSDGEHALPTECMVRIR